MSIQGLAFAEQETRANLTKLSGMVQEQHILEYGDPLKYSYAQMTVLFDRLNVAREAHDVAYAAWSEVA